VSDLRDELDPRPVTDSAVIYEGKIFDLIGESADLGEAGVVRREFLHHPGAVAILALDEADRVLLLRQYRHPVRMDLWELPAGLLDVPGEEPVVAARRELAEEADLTAQRWDVLADWFNSPGGSDETVRVFVARDLQPVPGDERHTRTDEEAGIVTRWVPLDEARDAVLAGHLHNPSAVVGILAACAAREQGWRTLRPADTPWPEHHAYR
jgi:8-oxo-dGDP phosphatase